MASLDTLDPSTAQPSSGPGEWADANPVNDPSLNALLADLQEGTLLSLMEVECQVSGEIYRFPVHLFHHSK